MFDKKTTITEITIPQGPYPGCIVCKYGTMFPIYGSVSPLSSDKEFFWKCSFCGVTIK
jgi:hypothetical protein